MAEGEVTKRRIQHVTVDFNDEMYMSQEIQITSGRYEPPPASSQQVNRDLSSPNTRNRTLTHSVNNLIDPGSRLPPFQSHKMKALASCPLNFSLVRVEYPAKLTFLPSVTVK